MVPQDNLPSLKGYIRGLRFCRPPLYLKELSELLLKPELSTELKLMVMDTFSRLDARQCSRRHFLPREGALSAQARREAVRGTGGTGVPARGVNALQVLLGFLANKDRMIRLLAIRALRELSCREPASSTKCCVNRFYHLLEEEDKDIRQEALDALCA